MNEHHSSRKTASWVQQVGGVIYVYNPNASNIQRSDKWAALLEKRLEKPATRINIRKQSRKLLTVIREQASSTGQDGLVLIMVGGGDGTFSSVVNQLLKKMPADTLKRLVLLPLWGGNANDFACMLNGLSSATTARRLLEHTKLIAAPVVRIEMRSKKSHVLQYACCYASFGASAYAAHELDSKRDELHGEPGSGHRFPPLVFAQELVAAVKALATASPFKTRLAGQNTSMYEHAIINGPRIAKINRVPVHLGEPVFFHAAAERSGLSLLKEIFRIIIRRPSKDSKKTAVRFTVKEAVHAQIDGEIYKIDAATKVSAKLEQPPFRFAGNPSAQATFMDRKKRWYHRPKFIIPALIVLALLLLAGWFHITNPYAKASIVQQPYVTMVKDGQVDFEQKFQTRIYANPVSDLIGYVKSGFLIVQNTLFGGDAVPGDTANEIIAAIHDKRFNPDRPYMISGDQFSVSYVRNLGVFYNRLMDPNTALNERDWQNRQRIYLQSTLYGIDGLTADKDHIRTTVIPLGPRSATMTQVHPGGLGSDSVFGVLSALQYMKTPVISDDGRYRVQTVAAAERVVTERKSALADLVERYRRTVQDPDNRLIKRDLHLASARDGAIRSSSFYDNVVLWRTLTLANELGIRQYDQSDLDKLKAMIETSFWNVQTGCYQDELDKPSTYSSDWLIALPAGYMSVATDAEKLDSCIAYIERTGLANPLPIKYRTANDNKAPFFVRAFVPNYGGNAIWSYWGAQYITLLAERADQGGPTAYRQTAQEYVRAYERAIVRDRGFAETFDAKGNFLQKGVYKSIRATGWVVQFEHARWLLARQEAGASQ